MTTINKTSQPISTIYRHLNSHLVCMYVNPSVLFRNWFLFRALEWHHYIFAIHGHQFSFYHTLICRPSIPCMHQFSFYRTIRSHTRTVGISVLTTVPCYAISLLYNTQLLEYSVPYLRVSSLYFTLYKYQCISHRILIINQHFIPCICISVLFTVPGYVIFLLYTIHTVQPPAKRWRGRSPKILKILGKKHIFFVNTLYIKYLSM